MAIQPPRLMAVQVAGYRAGPALPATVTHPYLLQRLQFLTRFETDGFAGRNSYFRPGTRIPANAGLARPHVEDSKTTQFDPVTAAEGFLHSVEHRLNRHLGLRFSDPRSIDNFVNNV
jgi:hypothetical protein